jgi:hypothetical protein
LWFANIFHERNSTDAAFDNDIGGTSNHHQMLDIVPPDEHEATSRINRCGIQNLQARLTIFATANEGRRTAASANKPQDDRKS